MKTINIAQEATYCWFVWHEWLGFAGFEFDM